MGSARRDRPQPTPPRGGASARRTAAGPRRNGGDRGRRRTLSQNFLTDTGLARALVRTAGVGPGDLVVEIGAGEGMLTRFLASACRRLIAYEVDPALAAGLSRRFAGRGVTVEHADIRTAAPPGDSFAAVGNIPYSITADIVDWCLAARGLTSATLVTQLEYARKRTGGYGRWSRLTVRTWPDFSWEMGRRIPRDRFHPVPRVDSAVLLLRRRARPLLPAHLRGAYRRLVDLGFTGTGGSLRASLRTAHAAHRVDAALAAAGIGRTTVVAFVAPDQWITLAAHLLDTARRPGTRHGG
ncbi:ErmE/ErmH/ErmO/ErmR family 23S rRNA (adenine(2058)-N(6))-methyltransferase [Nocardiopsis mangrovi]|uniref:ErmE/ErmH/ErmO/ErmR family 23S rRNA (Adenine(2058)-N(6))-methyltransferase n=1 Tax=Nocardiopsis mangrovi TaxID=1179818 RepID=A0ABV9E0C3_9ACTN